MDTRLTTQQHPPPPETTQTTIPTANRLLIMSIAHQTEDPLIHIRRMSTPITPPIKNMCETVADLR